MRSLAAPPYTAAQVYQRLREDTRIGFEVEVCDHLGNRLETLPASRTGDVGVFLEPSLAITANHDSGIKKDFRLRMRPYERLRNAPFQFRLRAWALLYMRDGGIARFSLGTYVVDDLERTFRPTTNGALEEVWEIVAGDSTYLLDRGGPSNQAFAVHIGELASDAMNRLLARVGHPRRVERLPVTLDRYESWTLTKPKSFQVYEAKERKLDSKIRSKSTPLAERVAAQGQLRVVRKWLRTHINNKAAVTWLSIANDICAMAGCYDLWFDWDDVPQMTPVRDLTTIKPDPSLLYQDGIDGLLASDFATTADTARRANRVTLVPLGDTKLKPVTVDANSYAPNHPLAERNCHQLIPAVDDEPSPVSAATLKARCVRRLHEGLARHEQTSFDALWNPALEEFDVLAGRMTNDAIYAAGVTLISQQFTINPYDFGVAHQAGRIFQ